MDARCVSALATSCWQRTPRARVTSHEPSKARIESRSTSPSPTVLCCRDERARGPTGLKLGWTRRAHLVSFFIQLSDTTIGGLGVSTAVLSRNFPVSDTAYCGLLASALVAGGE